MRYFLMKENILLKKKKKKKKTQWIGIVARPS